MCKVLWSPLVRAPVRAPSQSTWSSDSGLSVPPTTCPTNFSSQTAGRKLLGAFLLQMLPRSPGEKVCVPGREGRLYEMCVWLFVCECIMCVSAYLYVRACMRMYVQHVSVYVCSFVQVCGMNVVLCECL